MKHEQHSKCTQNPWWTIFAKQFIGVMPFFCAELLRVVLLLAFPALTLWLPRVLAG